MKLDFFYKNRD